MTDNPTQPNTPEGDVELIEKLAAIEHERWADWQKWCHKILRDSNPSPEIGDVLERWDRQIETPYTELTESEKQSDRDQVMRYWPLIQTAIDGAVEQARREEIMAIPESGLEVPNDYACYDLSHVFGKCINCYKQMRLGNLTPPPVEHKAEGTAS